MKVECSDYELIYLTREKNEDALRILIDKYSPLIGKTASSFYGVGYDYQDFFQEGLMAFIKAIETFNEDEEATFYSYSMTCVRNALRSVHRKLQRSTHRDYLVDEDQMLSRGLYYKQHFDEESHDEVICEKMLIEEVLKDDKALSELEKKCLKYYLLDNTYKEIAVILGVSPKKVDNALNRCKTKIKNLHKIKEQR